MKQLKLCWAFALLLAGLAMQVRGDTIINNFDTPGFNYVANGIIGDSSWDGVYLRLGDVTGGNAGGSPNGVTQVANTTDNGGYLTVTTSGTDWSGAGDDGFFLYRIVSGDFDMSVQMVPPYDNRANNFEGLMARAYTPNNSGIPFATTTTNAVENWVALLRMNQFNDDGEIRAATNGGNQEFVFPGSNTDTNSSRYLRITRVGNIFSFYVKTNDFDAWAPLTNAGGLASGSINRSDLAGIPMQVGIQGSAFSTAQRTTYFDNFQLSATNITTPVIPAAPSNVTVNSSNVNGSVDISWTPGAGSSGSLVLIRANGRNISQPVQGINYTADTDFKNTNTLLSAANAHVVYVGAGNSVTVTGLGGTNNTYDVAVFSYSGSGSSIAYNRDVVGTTTFIGPGQVANVTFTLNPPQIPAGGAAVAQVTATYTSGDSYDVSSDLSTIWVSSDPTVAVAGNGVVTGITNGTSTITATYASITGTNTATVVSPAFVENFDVNNNFLTNGVLGSKWDGIYLGAGDIPFQVAGNLGPVGGIVTNCDANISTNGMLTVVHRQTGFEGNENDGFFLFKHVVGDFQAAVKIEGYQNQAFQIPGLMVREFAPGGGPAGTTNATFTHGRENHIRWARFDEFAITTASRRAQNGGNQFFDQAGDSDQSFWLLMVRNGNTYRMYRRVNPTDNWNAVPAATQTLTAPTTNPIVQVGIHASTFDSGANFRSVSFSHFMLDSTNIAQTGTPPSAAASISSLTSNPDGTMTLNWVNGAGSDGSLVVIRSGRPINVKPAFGTNYTANSVYAQGSDLGSGSYVVYIGTGTSVTVTGLPPGNTYYAAVFAYSGTGATISYNTATTTQGKVPVLGVVQSLTLRLPQGNQLVNGGVLPYSVIANYVGGVTNDVSSQVTIVSTPSGNVVGTNGFLTGVTNGAASISVTFQTATTNASVIVRSPNWTDDFSVARDFLNNGAAGIWDGVYLGSSSIHPNNSIPGSVGAGQAVIADANTTSNNVLVVSTLNGNWVNANNSGFLLWRYVAGDFQASVQIQSIPKTAAGAGSVADLFAGLMARAFGNTNDLTGVPYNGAENWVFGAEYERFNNSFVIRHALNGVDAQIAIADGGTNDYYMLMKRQGGTFTFFRRVNPTDPYVALPTVTIVRPDLATVPMQVGVAQATYSANQGTASYANFMLDDAAPSIGVGNGGSSLALNWPGVPVLQLQSSGQLSPPTSWQPVVGVPAVTNGVSSLTVPINNSTNQFFRLAR
jgi:hypothetical protein